VSAGLRVLAPDLPGFGRSDKPIERAVYTYQRHVDWMAAFLDKLALRDLTLFCQDWGGLIGLRLVGEDPQGGDLPGQPLGIGRGVPMLDTDEDEQADVDPADGPAVDRHARLAHPLHDCPHGGECMRLLSFAPSPPTRRRLRLTVAGRSPAPRRAPPGGS
jgi:pimeloyl-ACP methyl ester carboxylesterase